MLPKHLKPFHINNENLTSVGPKLDGGYILDKRIINITEKIITCGLNDDWEFEKHFLKINPSCEVINENSLSSTPLNNLLSLKCL